MKTPLVALGCLLLVVCPVRGEGETDTSAVAATVRGFLIGAMTMEMEEVEKHALPHPDLKLLSEGQAPPIPVKRQMREAVGRAVCTFFAEGEEVRLPGGRTITVSAAAVSPGRCLVRPVIGGSPMPVPLAVIRTDAGWKVDATPLIEARKSAAKQRQPAG